MHPRCGELVEDRAAAEVQKEVQCQQFRELLKEKEREIEELAAAAEGRSNGGGGGQDGWGEDVNLEVPSSEVDLDRVAELEAALREEKERHQSEMLALQEEFARDGIQ